jgi:hypothetical protein
MLLNVFTVQCEQDTSSEFWLVSKDVEFICKVEIILYVACYLLPFLR